MLCFILNKCYIVSLQQHVISVMILLVPYNKIIPLYYTLEDSIPFREGLPSPSQSPVEFPLHQWASALECIPLGWGYFPSPSEGQWNSEMQTQICYLGHLK